MSLFLLDVADCMVRASNIAGRCADMPIDCDKDYAPVCGRLRASFSYKYDCADQNWDRCDQITYGNPCMAAAAGVNILKTGKCPRNTCVVPDGEDVCADGEYCALQEELCDLETTRLSGICKAKPTTCQMNIDPVCGCDGR